MLRYKFSLNKNNEGNEIPYERLYYGLNGNFITFKTSASSSLRDGQELSLECLRKGVLTQRQILTASVKTVKEQGYILYNRRYYLEKLYDNIYVLQFEDGKYYSTLSLDGNVKGETITINALDYCSIVEHTIQEEDSNTYYIEAPIKYYVYDGIVTIDDNEFEVDFSEIKETVKTPSITIPEDIPTDEREEYLSNEERIYWNDKNYEIEYEGKLTVDILNATTVVYDSEPTKWRTVQLVTLYKNSDFNLALDAINCADTIYSFNYEQTVDGVTKTDLYFFEKEKSKKNVEDNDYKLVAIYDEHSFTPIKYFKKEFFEAVECDADGETIENGKVYNIDHVYTDDTFGKYLNLYLKSQNFNPPLGTKIYATPLHSSSIYTIYYEEVVDEETEENAIDEENKKITFKKYVSIGGVKYYADDEPYYYILINGTEYLLTKVPNEYIDGYTDESSNGFSKGYYYFIQENNSDTLPTYVRIVSEDEDGNELESKKAYYTDSILCQEFEPFDVIERTHINIKGVSYKVHDAVPRYVYYANDKEPYELIGINEHIIYENKEVVTLIVIDKRSNNLITCAVVSNDNETSMAYSIASNYKSYVFSMSNEIIPSVLYDKEDAITRANGIDSYDPLDVVIYDQTPSINLPIMLSNDGALNLHQEDIVESEFVDKEIADRMNRIVDMEKDIYYPVVKKGTRYSDVNEIKFHLHFRERDDEWKIIEDGAWNIMNYPYGGCDNLATFPIGDYNKPQEATKYKYYQDSDLLGFLDFSDNDVFYQKQKISKSFLRISFFDSNNQRTQNLLYTATIFMNENALYKTYIDNMDDASTRKWNDISLEDGEGKALMIKNISVNAEPIGSTNNARLDATMALKNKYEAEESSEGFYLYIFREYSTNLRPRKIYMKVDFNHAGIGKTLAFFIPKKNDSNYKYGYEGEGDCLDFVSSEVEPMEWKDIYGETIEENGECKFTNNGIKDGIPLSNLYKSLFIPLNVQYDDKSQRYIYFFDEKFTENLYDTDGILHLNLYELKIKDES